ncbi:UNVERIFIED_ORG: hypothetical protein ABID57_003803 [Arthrobacter sp. UYEF1]
MANPAQQGPGYTLTYAGAGPAVRFRSAVEPFEVIMSRD